MHLRPATPTDLDAVAGLLTSVFIQDPLMSAIVAPAPDPRAALDHLHRAFQADERAEEAHFHERAVQRSQACGQRPSHRCPCPQAQQRSVQAAEHARRSQDEQRESRQHLVFHKANRNKISSVRQRRTAHSCRMPL